MLATREKAEAFVKDYNKENNLPQVPDWYMRAELVGPSEVPKGMKVRKG